MIPSSMDSTLVVFLVSIAWSTGLFVGLFSSKFISKKDCEKYRGQIWDRIDSQTDCMTGGKVLFELRMVQPRAEK